MRPTNSILITVLAIGMVSALAFAPLSQAGEKKQAASTPAAKVHRSTDLTMKRGTSTTKHEIRDTVTFTFQKIEAQYNPKELSIDKSVPWKQ